MIPRTIAPMIAEISMRQFYPAAGQLTLATEPLGAETTTAAPEGGCCLRTGGDLLSQAREGQVPSALRGLTALFGMGRGVSLSLFATENVETGRRTWRRTSPGGA